MDGRIVKVSAAMARLTFHGCEPDYIRDVCHASCCDSSVSPNGVLITIHRSEQAVIEARGGVVEGGFLMPRRGERKCYFKASSSLCSLHETADKPFGCIASPFTLNASGTLIVRNRYRLLKCYKKEPRLPAYHAFRAALDLLFGRMESARISAHLDAGGGDLLAEMRVESYQMLNDNDKVRHAAPPPKHQRDKRRPTTADGVRDLVRAGKYREAVLQASKFQDLGEARSAVLDAREAYLRPDFQRALGRDTDRLIAAGVAALQEKYGT